MIAAVILTTGDRPAELAAAVRSVRDQAGVTSSVVVVANTAAPVVVPDGVTLVEAGENLGIPAGRNLGASRSTGELVLFLDDDARLADPEVLRTVEDAFRRDPQLAVVTLRLVDPRTGATERRHVPRLRVGDPGRSSWVTTFLGGASVVRREAFDAAGGLPGGFIYAHEETDLAWRLLDLGWRIRYRGDLRVEHPAASPSRHPDYHVRSARNRVLLVRRRLPWPIAAAHLGVWFVLGLVRDPKGLRPTLAGFWSGVRERDVQRRPIGWRTVLRMTFIGRPPVV